MELGEDGIGAGGGAVVAGVPCSGCILPGGPACKASAGLSAPVGWRVARGGTARARRRQHGW